MQHVAIDLGSKDSQVCIRRPDGTIVLEKKHPTRRLSELLRTTPHSRVIVETSAEAFRIADAAKAAGQVTRCESFQRRCRRSWAWASAA